MVLAEVTPREVPRGWVAAMAGAWLAFLGALLAWWLVVGRRLPRRR